MRMQDNERSETAKEVQGMEDEQKGILVV